MTSEKLIEYIQSYNYYVHRIEEIKKKLKEITPTQATAYGDNQPAKTNAFHSKTERQGIQIAEYTTTLDRYMKRVKRITNCIENSGLTEHEKGVMWYVAQNYKLQAYARKNNIQQSNVYKIRDRATKKILSRLHNTK